MTDAAHADKADSDTAPAKTLEGRRPALAPGPVGGQELASVSGTGIPLRRPASMLGLQRLAGNRSVAQMLQRAPVVQRADKPTTLTEALRTGESDQLQPFRPFTGITPHQLLSLVNLIVTEAWVAPWEETMLEEAWTARGSADLTEADWTLWQSCAKRGANIRNVPWLRELRASFADKVYETAKDNLYRSGQTLEKEKTKLGIGAEKPTADQDAAIKRQQELARKVKRANEALNKLTLIDVGYADPPAQSTSSDSSRYGGGSKPGGLDDAAARTEIITTHLQQMEVQLQQTRDTVGALRELLAPVGAPAYVEVQRRPALAVWSVGATIEVSEIDNWFGVSLKTLRDAVATADSAPVGVVPGGLYDRSLFLESRGKATLFVPAPHSAQPPEGVRAEVLPAAEFAVLTHSGGHDDIDRSYGALGRYVNEHLLSHQGPIREHYIGATPSAPTTFTATEICWPIFSTTPPPA